jgi:hypothetical protein
MQRQVFECFLSVVSIQYGPENLKNDDDGEETKSH